jgi:hypothetical protein
MRDILPVQKLYAKAGKLQRIFLITLITFCACALPAQTTAPDWQERWGAYVQRTYNWRQIGMVAAETAVEQTFQLNKCGRPPYCFPHRIGGALARRTARTTIELGAGALLHEDIRRRPSGLTGFRRRAAFAILHAPLARGADGGWQPAYSRFVGTFGAAAVSSAWHGRPLSGPRLFESFGWSATTYFQDALLTEFEGDIRRLGRRLIGRRFTRVKSVSPPAPAPCY